MMSKNAKRKILTAAVLCACTSLWASPVWAQEVRDNIVYGEFNSSKNGSVSNAKAVVENGNYDGVVGGSAFYTGQNGEGTAISNVVNITGGTITDNNNLGLNTQHPIAVVGGYANMEASENVVNISENAQIYGDVYGGYTQRRNGRTIANEVNISGGSIEGNIYGAYSNSSATVTGNVINITGGKIIGNVYAGFLQSAGEFKDNGIKVLGNEADLSQTALAGYQSKPQDGCENVYLIVEGYKKNIKLVSEFSKVDFLSGSNVEIESINLYFDDDEDWNEICGNLTVDNSRLNANEIGYVNQLKVQNGGELIADEIDLYNNYELCGDLTVDNSKIEVNNLGYTKNILLTNSEAKIKNLDYFDSMTIDNDNAKIASLGNIRGQIGGTTSVIFTDSKFTADSIKNLKELNVDMSYINWEKDTAVVDVSGTADFTRTSISASGTLAAAAGTEVQNGDRMSLIKANTLTGANAANVNVDKLQIGFATEAKVEMQDSGNSIDFVITGAQQANEQAGIIGESRTAAIAFVNQGSDILNNAFGLMDDGKYGIKTFAAAHGNYSKYETGSHIRVNGWSMIAGVGNSDKLEDGTFSWGVFFENGSGNYRTYNDYNGYNLRGFGSAVYNGGGALARYRSNAGNYAEVGVRAGMLKNSLGNAVADGYGVQGGYDEETSYYGAHLGVGHIFAVDENSNVDVYGKYFYNHHESKDLNILGDEVRFDSADSNRLRLGLRYNQNDGNAFSHYYGLAWDYEFSGDANVTAAGFDTGNPSLKGSTAVIEAGIHYAPDNSPWSIDLGLQGYGGQRDGFSGTMQLNYSFN